MAVPCDRSSKLFSFKSVQVPGYSCRQIEILICLSAALGA